MPSRPSLGAPSPVSWSGDAAQVRPMGMQIAAAQPPRPGGGRGIGTAGGDPGGHFDWRPVSYACTGCG